MRPPHHDGSKHLIVNVEVVVREAAALMRQDPVVGVFGRILRHADPEGWPLFHALENEIDAIGALLAHSAQPGQDLILFADTFLAPLDGNVVVPGKSFHPVLIVIGALGQYLLAQDWDSEDLAKEMNHLLRPRQSAQVTVDDDSVEAMVHKEQQPAEKLREHFHGTLILLGFGERREPQKDQSWIGQTRGGGRASARQGDQIHSAPGG